VWPGISQGNAEPPSSWSIGGQPLPDLPYGWTGSFISIFALYADGLKAIDAHPDAVIPVERINGPIILVCGQVDTLWPSCPMADQVAVRLHQKDFKPAVQVLTYPDAGHAVFGPPVAVTEQTAKSLSSLGGSAAGNASARADSWPQALSFLDAALKR
jgi:dienelactone hydrolase